MPENPNPSTDPAEEKAKEPTFEGEFDADRAKRTIANLREEVAQLKERQTAIAAERDEFKAAAEKSGEERDTALKAALKRAEDAERALVLKDAGLPDDVVEEFADFLTGTPDEVKAKAARLAARIKPAETPPAEETPGEGEETGEEEEPELPSRPRPGLKPGHAGNAGDPDPELDLDAIIAGARR